MFSAASTFDPFAIPHVDRDNYPSRSNPSGRSARPSRLQAGERTGVFICVGQSNMGNWVGPTPFVPTNAAKIDNLNVFDGGLYAAADPVLGCDGVQAFWPLRFADQIITENIFDRVIIVPVAIGSSTVLEWQPGGQYHPRLLVAGRRCRALSIPVTAVLWQQGENEATTTQSEYEARFGAMFSAARADGLTAPWLVGKSTWRPTVGANATIRSALTAVVDGLNKFAGGDTDSLTFAGGYRQADSPHFNDAGAAQCATLWKNAWVASGL